MSTSVQIPEKTQVFLKRESGRQERDRERERIRGKGVRMGTGGIDEERRVAMNWKCKGVVSTKWAFMLCILSFCAGLFFTNRLWSLSEAQDAITPSRIEDYKAKLDGDCHSKSLQINKHRDPKEMLGEASKMNYAIHTLDKTISSLEIELATARATKETILDGTSLSDDLKDTATGVRQKYLMVVGINTAFSSRKRRDSIRATWMPQGDKRKKLEEEKGIIIRFVISYSATSGGILDQAIEAENRKYEDFLRLDHNEGYLELSGKTKAYFATAVNLWDAEFYVKVDDDIHVNIANLVTTLTKHRSKPGLYIGCMKSGPVLAQKSVRYHEPEYWKFGAHGNKYFRHATGQLYAISRDLAIHISINQHVLHKYANEDVSMGAWLIGLNVEHIDDRKLCCGTPPDCEWKAQAGNICVASFDWSCSGICRSVERMEEVHHHCGEGENALWNVVY